MPARLELHVNKPRTLGLCGLGVLMVASSCFCTTLPERTAQVVGWFGVVFFGACLFIIARQLFRSGPQFIIDERGLEDRRGKGFLIEWPDITAISIGGMGRERFLCVEVTNPQKYLDGMSRMARTAARANRGLGFSELTIAFSGLTHTPDDVLQFIRKNVPGFRSSMKHLKGDLLKFAREGAFDVIAHGCNCFCTMGAGIAKSIAASFPQALAADRQTIKGDRGKLGTCTCAEVISAHGTLIVVNAYTQFDFRGAGTKANYDAIRSCMRWIARTFPGKRIGVPRIGAGLAGGDWPTIEAIIAEELATHDVTVVEFQP